MSRLEYPEIRYWILRILYNNLPEYCGDKLISQLLDRAYDLPLEEVRGQLRYLAEKDYVTLKDVSLEDMGLYRILAKLTSKGVDYVEGNLEDDPGVDKQ